ncbi:MAG: serine hydrolase domain-containing protein [Verrucomicrobiales bacterium]
MPHLTRRRFLVTAAGLPAVRFAGAEDTTPEWRSKLEEIRIQYKLPALGGAIVNSSGLQSVAVTGVRKVDSDVAATVDDLWHLGSNTKAMTSTLAAVAVEAGKIDWETTLEQVFRGESGLNRSPLREATLTHFLSHWSGLPANPIWTEAARGGKDLRSQRAKVMEMAIELSDLPGPGEKHLYSNWGYVIAGHMLERVLRLSWEEQMRKAVFDPLGLTGAGFGGTGTPGKIDQPWPHGEDGRPMPKNGPEVDNLPVLGPAGTVHMSFVDWAKFIADHLAGGNGGGKLLKAATYERLHTAAQEGEPYAYGWLALERSWGGRVLSHSGSNTMNRSVAWLAPEKDFAVLACSNQGSEECRKALDDAASMLIGEVT